MEKIVIFAHKKAKADNAESGTDEIVDLSSNDIDLADDEQDDESDAGSADPWDELDAHDWREDGPFDIHEVDLDADEIERIDFGSLILTPFDGMQMQLQMDEASKEVQAVLIMHENSALEMSLFAAPAATSMMATIRQEMVTAAEAAGGEVSLVKGPFGTEIRRVLPMAGPKGEQLYHVSRTWFAQGPAWLLRGILMGEAGTEEGLTGASKLLYEIFSNTVVRRGKEPRVPGSAIGMTLPEGLLADKG